MGKILLKIIGDSLESEIKIYYTLIWFLNFETILLIKNFIFFMVNWESMLENFLRLNN